MRSFLARIFTAALVAAALVPAGRAADEDLAMVPGDAAGFVHVRIAELWKHDLMKGVRDAAENAGSKALAAFEKQVYPPLASLDRATFIVIAPEGQGGGPIMVAVVRFTEAFDKDKFLKLFAAGAEAKKVNGKAVYFSEKDDFNLGFHFPDDKHVVVGKLDQVEAFLARPPVLKGGISPALETAAKGATVVAAVNVRALPIPPLAFNDIPENIRPLMKADRVTLTLDLRAASPVLTVRAGYAGEQLVADAEMATKEAVKTAKLMLTQPKAQFQNALLGKEKDGPRPVQELPELAGALIGLGSLNQLEQYLDALPIKRDGTDLTASVTVPKEFNNMAAVYPVMLGLMLPAVQKVREAAGRAKSSNNLKQLALGVHAYHDTNGKMPANIYSKDGKPLLSWRVHLLPYIEQDQLYKQFKLDEPWDSEHNKKLLPLMPPTFMVPNAKNPPAGKTYYQGFVSAKGANPRSVFSDDPKDRTTLIGMTDGTSNTILIAEAADGVEWTKPADIPFDEKKDVPKLGGHSAGGFLVALGDGSVRFVSDKVDPKTLKAAITMNGGEVLGLDW